MQQTNPEESGLSITVAKQSRSQREQPKWDALIDDALVPAPQREVRATVLLEQAGAPDGKVLVRDHGGEEDVAIEPNEVVDLAAGNVFYLVDACDAPTKRQCTKPAKLALFVDDRPEITLNPNQTGKTIRDLFGLQADVELIRDYESPRDEVVDLAAAAPFARGPVFITRRQHTTLTIIINGREKTITQRQLSYDEVVRLAFASTEADSIYTVTYKKGPDHKPSGSMVQGDVVKVKNGMIFNVTQTRKS